MQFGVPFGSAENFELRRAINAIVIGLVSVASGLLFWAAALLGAMLAARWAFGRPIREALDL